MPSSLSDTFNRYLAPASGKLGGLRAESDGHLDEKLTDVIRQRVEDLEGMDEFHDLVAWTRAEFSGDYHFQGSIGDWREAVTNWFRRSGCYIDVLVTEPAYDERALFDAYRQAFMRKTHNVQYLALMEYVEFAEEAVEFSDFSIQRLGRSDIQDIFCDEGNKLFFPWAYLDTHELAGNHYWFIRCSVEKAVSKIGDPSNSWLHFDLDDIDIVKQRFTSYPKAIESVLSQLVLFDWNWDLWRNRSVGDPEIQRREDSGWDGFDLPVVFSVHDDLLSRPAHAPTVPPLQTEPDFIPDTGEEIERPAVMIRLDTQETGYLRNFIDKIEKLLANLGEKENEAWRFLHVALGFLVKAFFARNLEQLLWHITVIEALLGEDQQGLVTLLKKRLKYVLGKTKGQKTEIGKKFDELYDFRSNLVHGNVSDKRVYIKHLRFAREFARKTVLWFLNYLSAVAKEVEDSDSKTLPSRRELLQILDSNPDQRAGLLVTLQSVPNGFPCVEDWTK